MNKIHILIPWDELSDEQKQAIGYQTASTSNRDWGYDRLLKHCTTPLRTPDEWTDAEQEELYGYICGCAKGQYWGREVANKALEIATRPPKRSAVEEFEKRVRMIGVPHLWDEWVEVKEEAGIDIELEKLQSKPSAVEEMDKFIAHWVKEGIPGWGTMRDKWQAVKAEREL